MTFTTNDLIKNVYPNTIISIATDMKTQIVDSLNYIKETNTDIDENDLESLGKKIGAFVFAIDSLENSFKFIHSTLSGEMIYLHKFCTDYVIINTNDVKQLIKAW